MSRRILSGSTIRPIRSRPAPRRSRNRLHRSQPLLSPRLPSHNDHLFFGWIPSFVKTPPAFSGAFCCSSGRLLGRTLCPSHFLAAARYIYPHHPRSHRSAPLRLTSAQPAFLTDKVQPTLRSLWTCRTSLSRR